MDGEVVLFFFQLITPFMGAIFLVVGLIALAKLKSLSSRRYVQSVIPALYRIRVYMRGWLNYYGIAAMKNSIEELNKWLYHRIRMCIWKMWKRPRSKMKYLMKLGIPKYYAHMAANSRRGY